MKFINHNLLQQELSYNGNGYLPFVEQSIIEIIKENSNTENSNTININSTEIFWLFSYIKNNFRSTLALFYNYNIENEIFGFPIIQRELRHSIEAFLDLYNLVDNEQYINVLMYCSNSYKNQNKDQKNNIDLGDYRRKLSNRMFTIQSKYKISGIGKKTFDYGFYDIKVGDLVEMASNTNSYTHPDVYIDINKINENIEEILIKLIKMNVFLLVESFELFVKGIKSLPKDRVNLSNNYVLGNGNYYYDKIYQQRRDYLCYFVKNKLIFEQTNPTTNNFIY